MLKAKLFPPPPPADLSDIPGLFSPAAADCPMTITNDEVIANIQRLKSDKAPGPDGITNRILKDVMGYETSKLITSDTDLERGNAQRERRKIATTC